MHRPVRNAFLLGVLVGLVVALVRAVRASDHSPAAMGAGAGALPVPRPERAGAPRSSSAPAATARADEPPGTPPSVTPPPAPTDADRSEPESPADHPSDAADTGHSSGDNSGDNSGDEPNLGATAADPALAAETPPDPIVAARPDEATSPAPPAPGTVWVEPVDGGCPEGYPVKAKATSRIFHVVGGLSYERTVPDRCYATAAAAEADGFRAAKR